MDNFQKYEMNEPSGNYGGSGNGCGGCLVIAAILFVIMLLIQMAKQ